MTSMAAPSAFDTEALRRAIERSDAAALLALYSDDAEFRMVDRNTQPSHPAVAHGKAELSALLSDVYGREMTHTLEQVLIDGDRLAYLESCRYPDGTRVLASAVCSLKDGRIIDETMIQAWDE